MRKGRSAELIVRRNNALWERWLYWTEDKRLRFDDAVRKLANDEFFLSEERVIGLLRQMIKEDKKVVPKSGFKGFRLKCDI